MYKCNDCQREFEKTERYIREKGEFWGAPYTEYYEGCPYCESEDISALVGYCDFCRSGLYGNDSYYILPDGSRFCEDCVRLKEV